MSDEMFSCEYCKYKTKHKGHWKRHLDSQSHRNKSCALVPKSTGVNEKEEDDDVASLKERNISLGETVKQIHELLMSKCEENVELRSQICNMQKEICLLKQMNKATVSAPKNSKKGEETRINNTFIFVIDNEESSPLNIMDIMSNMHKKIKSDNGGRVGNSQVVILGLNDFEKSQIADNTIIE